MRNRSQWSNRARWSRKRNIWQQESIRNSARPPKNILGTFVKDFVSRKLHLTIWKQTAHVVNLWTLCPNKWLFIVRMDPRTESLTTCSARVVAANVRLNHSFVLSNCNLYLYNITYNYMINIKFWNKSVSFNQYFFISFRKLYWITIPCILWR